MKYSFILALFLLISCGQTQNAVQGSIEDSTYQETVGPNPPVDRSNKVMSEEEVKDEVEYVEMEGLIKLNHKGCENVVIVKVGESELTLFPVNLSKEFKVNDRRVAFSYEKLKQSLPYGCKADFVVKIIDISNF